MKKTSFILAVVLFIAVLAIASQADEGSIRVDISKVDELPADIIILILITGVMIVLLGFAIFVAKGLPKKKDRKTDRNVKETAADLEDRPQVNTTKTERTRVKRTKESMPGTRLIVRKNKESVKDDIYYRDVFEKPVAHIADEKATPVEIAVTAGGIERYLKEDERIIINVLKMKNSSCSQGTIRVVTDFSKAKLSRVLDELEQRGIIHKQRDGRKNIVTLKAC